LAAAIDRTTFQHPICPIYQNVNALPSVNIAEIKKNLIVQLTAPVRWTQSVQNMAKDGATHFVECGPGKVLQGLVRKIVPGAEVASL
jgi:[acyl-carrier-protein] S-malonyltransferase